MNAYSTLRTSAEEPTSLRAQSKLKTRKRVLEAARRLFMERGYDPATIRDIAADAGLSTGAVFASFSDKTDLFNAVMAEDFQRLVDRLKAVVRPDDSVEEGVLAVFRAGYEFHGAQLPLLQAAVSLSWSHGLGGEFGDRPTQSLAMQSLTDVLNRGVERGELKADADLRLVAEVLWEAYVGNYRRALFDSWSIGQLIGRVQSQIELILAGVKA
jgi:AcrR family transcriptional regulator